MSVTGAGSSGEIEPKCCEFGADWRRLIAWFGDAKSAAGHARLETVLEVNDLSRMPFFPSIQAVGNPLDGAGPAALLNVFRKRRCNLAKVWTLNGRHGSYAFVFRRLAPSLV